jgi:hypothetical protein
MPPLWWQNSNYPPAVVNNIAAFHIPLAQPLVVYTKRSLDLVFFCPDSSQAPAVVSCGDLHNNELELSQQPRAKPSRTAFFIVDKISLRERWQRTP